MRPRQCAKAAFIVRDAIMAHPLKLAVMWSFLAAIALAAYHIAGHCR